MPIRLGFDIGGVVIAEIQAAGGLAHIDDNYLDVPPVPDVFSAISVLEDVFGPERHLISKARAEVEGNCRAWLHHYCFFERTHLSGSNLHFCRERSGKRAICERLGITHFVDDKLEVLANLVGVVPHLYLFNPKDSEVLPYVTHLKSVTLVYNWQSLIKDILESCT